MDVFGSIIPREQRQTAEGAERPSSQAHCSRGQSTPVARVSTAAAICTQLSGTTCAGDAGLNLRGVLPGRAVGRDLVQRVGGHVGGLMSSWSESLKVRDGYGRFSKHRVLQARR